MEEGGYCRAWGFLFLLDLVPNQDWRHRISLVKLIWDEPINQTMGGMVQLLTLR